MSRLRCFLLQILLVGLIISGQPGEVAAETDAPARGDEPSRSLPQLRPRSSLNGLAGRPLLEVVVVDQDAGREAPVQLQFITRGDLLSPELVRRAMRELLDSGKYASVRAEIEPMGEGVRLRLLIHQRKILADVRITGGTLEAEASLRVSDLELGQEITQPDLRSTAARLWQYYQYRGYPNARVAGRWQQADSEERVIAVFDVQPGPPKMVAQRVFSVVTRTHPRLQPLLASYAVDTGDRADGERLEEADLALATRLRQEGFHRASVSHEIIQLREGSARLKVVVDAGPMMRLHFEGNVNLDNAALLDSLELDDEDRSEETLIARLRKVYLDRGFPDVVITTHEVRGKTTSDLWFRIRENRRLRVVGREFPCLSGPRDGAELNDEFDAFVNESLPGGDDVLGAVDSSELDRSIAPSETPGRRAKPDNLTPTHYYAADVYERAAEHVRDLYRSEGYLSAVVGPVVVLRRQCHPLSAPGACRPIGVRQSAAPACPTRKRPIPTEDTEGDAVSCTPDAARGIYCETDVVLSIPIKLGPRTALWDVEFVGNERRTASQLSEVTALDLGKPVSQFGLQQARRRILEHYAGDGFAFASVEVDLDLSEDHTLGRARFIISEREPVRIRGFVIRGNVHTSEGVILSRLDVERGGLFERDLVRQSEEQLATLGVFASVTIALEDPEVPAREKMVVITVQELARQYIDVRPGISTGEGFRAAAEYGHRNIYGRAVQARIRAQLSYLPDFLIFEAQVRRNFDALSTGDRLERRNTATLEFPIAKKYRLAVEGVDVRDNSRDFGITKRAGIVTLTHRTTRTITLVGGSSVELNDARIFGETETLRGYLEANPQQARLLNVPEGRSFAIALRTTGRWDTRDNPLGATRGMFVSAEAEPVTAFLDEDSAAIQLDQCAQAGGDPATCEFKSTFIKLSQRTSGYIPFTDKGLSLALSLHVGAIIQLVENSSTYPDRFFFLGGGDSLRGHLQASVIPQDIAEQLVEEDPNAPDDDQRLTARKVVIRGGDFLINPRAELRIPLSKIIQTALFVDSGNIWRDLSNTDPTVLRYTAGSGIRAVTPIGPLAFDYGIKLDRRFYEDTLGAFHFSVGLF